MDVLSERFSWFWVSYGLINFLLGALLALGFVVTLKRKGVVALLMVPFAIHLMLWSTWAGVRESLVIDWLYERQYEMGMTYVEVGVQIAWYYFIGNGIFSLCLAFAFVPFFIKDKAPVVATKPEEPPKPF